MAKKHEFVVASGQKVQRIDQYLSSKVELGITRSQIHKLIDDGCVEVNKNVVKPSYKVKLDDCVVITLPSPQKLEARPENINLDIVYEDSDLVVVNKSRGMVVHPAAGNGSGTLVNALLNHCKDLSGIGGVLRPGIVHRLDKDTSGLIVIAKNDFTHQGLAKQFMTKKIFKQYVALVRGTVKKGEGVISAMIGRHPKHRKKMAVIAVKRKRWRKMGDLRPETKGRDAVTHYKVVERFNDYSLLELVLETGRTHQIRVHLDHIGHPIVGDPTYGRRKEEFVVSGQLLHSRKLGFVHPRTNKYVEFECLLPEDMEEVLRALRMRQAGQGEKAAR